MEKKHTPTPWLTSGIDSRIIVCKRGYSICDTGGSVMLDVDEDKANAEFIVEACNNYERLVKENEEIDKAALSWKETSEKLSEAVNEYREETERLQSENERMRDLLVKRKKYIGEFPLFVQSLYSDELDEINNVLNPK